MCPPRSKRAAGAPCKPPTEYAPRLFVDRPCFYGCSDYAAREISPTFPHIRCLVSLSRHAHTLLYACTRVLNLYARQVEMGFQGQGVGSEDEESGDLDDDDGGDDPLDDDDDEF